MNYRLKNKNDRHFASHVIRDWPCGIYLISVNEPTWTAYFVEKARLELATYCLQNSRSNHLNYNPVLVGSAGVEPEQTAPKTVVLTITPQANTKMPKKSFCRQ